MGNCETLTLGTGTGVVALVGIGEALKPVPAVGVVESANASGRSSFPTWYLISNWNDEMPLCAASGSNGTMAIPTTPPMMNRARNRMTFNICPYNHLPNIALTFCWISITASAAESGSSGNTKRIPATAPDRIAEVAWNKNLTFRGLAL